AQAARPRPSDRAPTDQAPQAVDRSVDAVPPPAARRRVLAEDSRLPAGRRADVPRPQLAGQAHDHQSAEAVAGGAGPRAADVLRRRLPGVCAGADVDPRVAVPAVADRL